MQNQGARMVSTTLNWVEEKISHFAIAQKISSPIQ
jgi:hypothetical protein